MTDRKYSLKEIDAMRLAIYKSLPPVIFPGPAYNPTNSELERINTARASVVEDRLRTALMAGLGPQDFEHRADG